jgi:hypothetical protein
MAQIDTLTNVGAVVSTDLALILRGGANVLGTFGSLVGQNATAVTITGGTVNGTVIGGVTAAAGSFTTVTASGEIAANGGIALGDNDKATFGSSDDMELYHDGNNSYINDTGTGALLIRGSNVSLGKYTGETMVNAFADGRVDVYYDNAIKLTTTTSGIDVTGTVTADGLTVEAASGAEAARFVTNDATAANNAGALIYNIASATAATRNSQLILDPSGANASGGDYLIISAKGDNSASIINYHATSTLALGTAGIERMRIDASGNVGIGNSAPLGKLTISNAAGANAPSTVTAANTYLQLGSDDYGPSNNGKFMIGFGFTDATNTNSPAYIGYEEVSTSGDTYGDLTFYTRSVTTDTAPTERLRINNSGNVGIGRSSADTPLHVAASNGTTYPTLGTASGVIGASINELHGMYLGVDGPSGNGWIQAMREDGTGTAYDLVLQPSGGNVGIGVVPSAWAGTSHGSMDFGVTGAVNADLQVGVNLSQNMYWTGAAWTNKSASYATSYYNQSNDGHEWYYNTAAALGTFTPTRLMKLDASGNLLVGTSTTNVIAGRVNGSIQYADGSFDRRMPAGTCDWGIAATSGGICNFYSDNGSTHVFAGNITVAGSTTGYNTSSDYRLKEDAVPMTGATERVKALRPINFAWKADGSRTDGFLAHEAQEVVPEAVHGTKDAMRDEEYEVTPAVEEVRDEDGNVTTEAVAAVMGTRSVPDYQGIDQSKLVPLLTATIQELIARIEALEGA